MAVPEQTPYSEHTGNGVTKSFLLGFICESKDHLIVLVDEIEPPIATWSLSGGNVVFTTAPISGSKITLQRNTPFGRTTEYQSFNNSFRPQSVNGDFDRLWLKLQELGVADWLMKLYVDRLHQQQEVKINDLKSYVDDRDDELRSYLMEEIRKQGVALDQLDEYYNYLMERLAQIAVDKGWDASFVVDGDKNQKQINAEINIKSKRDNETIYDYGAIGDGVLHTVQEWYTAGSNNYNQKYKGLADVQADYSFVTDKDFSIDQAAILKLAYKRASTGGGTVDLSVGEFMVKPINDGACLPTPGKVTLAGRGDDTILHEITPINDDPNTSVSWDLILFSGKGTVGGGAKDFTVKHTGGRRNNTASIATRAGAVRQKYSNINFESTIGSSIVIEYSVANPKPTFCRISRITSKPTGRHSVYISGASGNIVKGNTIYLNALEGIAIRGEARNEIEDNDFIGVEGVRTHAVCLAQPPSGSKYNYKGLKLKSNRGHNLFGAGFYGQGNNCELYDADVSGNDWELSVTDPLVTQHHMMFYRTYRSNISNNVCRGGRNRGIMFYGCAKNDIHSNTLNNVLGIGNASVGAIGFASYKDVDDITYYSTDNKLIGNKIIDDRETPQMKIGIQMFAGCVRNLVSKTEFEGIQTKIDSADGLSAQIVGDIVEKLLFSKSINTGTNEQSDMKFVGDNTLAYVNQNLFIKSLRLSLQQITILGTVTARLYKNGSALVANVFTADNSSKVKVLHFQPGQYVVSPGDTLNVKIETEGLTSNQTALSFLVEVVLAQ